MDSTGRAVAYRFQVELLPRDTSNEKQVLEVISSSDTGAISLALFVAGDIHGKKFYPGEVTLLAQI